LTEWVLYVKEYGLSVSRKITGFNDEKVKGKERKGQRSIRLNKAYRAFYIIDKKNAIRFVEVIEVNKHEY
jgi:proteic killer suppression protein